MPGTMEVISVCSNSEGGGDLAILASILGQGPRSDLPPAGAKVCQPCGELATWDSEEGRAAGHVHGGEFIGFSPGHANCEFSPYPAHLRRRPYRYCEVCRGRIEPRADSRRGLSWLCQGCAGLIDASGHSPGMVLDELALRRFARIGGHLPHRGEGKVPEAEVGLGDFGEQADVPPPPDWIPQGLYLCVVCGEPRGSAPSPGRGGEIVSRASRCVCDGPACVGCGRPRSHPPVSDHYHRASGTWLHVAYFVGMKRYCDECEPDPSGD